MNPYQVICLSAVAPDLFTSSYGPFVVNACATLADIADALLGRRNAEDQLHGLPSTCL